MDADGGGAGDRDDRQRSRYCYGSASAGSSIREHRARRHLHRAVTVRFLLADDPPLHGCGIGKVITVTLTTSGQSRRFRITARADIANVVRLTVEAVDR